MKFMTMILLASSFMLVSCAHHRSGSCCSKDSKSCELKDGKKSCCSDSKNCDLKKKDDKKAKAATKN